MGFVCGSLLLVFVGICTDGVDRQNQLFTSWQEARREVKSLVVKFTLVTSDVVFKEGQKAEGSFRLIRTTGGEIFASYELTQPKMNDEKPDRWTGLLNKGTVYLLNQDVKSAIRIEPTDGDLREFLERHFNPFVLFLDEKYAKEKCYLQASHKEADG